MDMIIILFKGYFAAVQNCFATQLIEFVSLAYSLFDTVFAQKNILEKTLCVQVGEGEEAIHRTCEYIVSHLVENWRLK